MEARAENGPWDVPVPARAVLDWPTTDKGPSTMFRFRVQASSSQLGRFFRRQLKTRGWDVVAEETDHNTVFAERGSVEVMITVGESGFLLVGPYATTTADAGK